MISRFLPEWAMVALAASAGIAIAWSADARLGEYILRHPGVSLSMLSTGWTCALLGLAFVRGAALILCRHLGPSREGVCERCPLSPDCAARTWRARSGAAGAVIWGALAMSLAIGDTFYLPAVLTGGLAMGEFAFFVILSRHVPWIRSLR